MSLKDNTIELCTGAGEDFSMVNSFVKWISVIVVTAIASGYIGYLYAEYENAFYCEKSKIPTIAT